MKPRPFIITLSVDVEHLDRVFEPAVEPTRPSFEVRNRTPGRILTRVVYFVTLVLNDRQWGAICRSLWSTIEYDALS